MAARAPLLSLLAVLAAASSCTPFAARSPYTPTYARAFNVSQSPDGLWKFLAVATGSGALTSTTTRTIVCVPACSGQTAPTADAAGARTGDSLLVLPVPPVLAAITSSTYLPAFELAGARALVSAVNGAAYYYSPCLRSSVASGTCADVASADGYTLNRSAPALAPTSTVILRNWNSPLGTSHDVPMAETREADPLAVVEWGYYVAAIFGFEDAALASISAAKGRYGCMEALATSALGTVAPTRPKVIWGYRWPNPGEPGASDDYYYGEIRPPRWYLEACPGAWYCPIVADAGGTLIPAPHANYSDAEFLLLASGADVLVYTGADWTSSMAPMAASGGLLADLPAVKSQRVFDITASGIDAWFEQRPAQPDALLQDLVLALAPAAAAAVGFGPNPVFLRNVFTGLAGSLQPLTACNQAIAAVPALASNNCPSLSAPGSAPGAAPASTATLSGPALAGTISAAIIFGALVAAIIVAVVVVRRRSKHAAASAIASSSAATAAAASSSFRAATASTSERSAAAGAIAGSAPPGVDAPAKPAMNVDASFRHYEITQAVRSTRR